MSRVNLTPRDLSLLRLLDWTPLTTSLLLRANEILEGEPFPDQRRLRERLQALAAAGFVRSWNAAHDGEFQNYYKLSPQGFQIVHGHEAPLPTRAYFSEVSPTFTVHTFRLAETIIETMRACRRRRVTVVRFFRENSLTFTAGDRQVQPDAFFVLDASGRRFNVAIELDNSTESNESHAINSILHKLSVYDAYQEQLLSRWTASGKQEERPRFHVAFLTKTVVRAYHILALAAEVAGAGKRKIVRAASFDAYVTDRDRLFAPIFLDHSGNWQALLDLHPTAAFQKEPVRLTKPVASPFVLV